ncbi:Speckle-type POZ protein-like B [Araneus ventricosus]|uniref:Speckle-type POZ protein-like B n=1 Tax=Araneus ventricosus TaxID=182803 RepID=A0A4Y2EVY5_ARAVE|nr:Speckle-type POZ protein-like B [Araneus ventricosus]
MSLFLIDLEIDTELCVGRKFIDLEAELNDEWAVAIGIYKESVFGSCVLETIEIHRKYTSGNLSVSGELEIEQGGRQIWEKKFSQIIKSGLSYTRIYNGNFDKSIMCNTKCRLLGLLNISYDSEKYATGLANGESKERIKLKSLEELGNGESKNRIQLNSPEELSNGESNEKIQLKSTEKLENGESEERIQENSLEELANGESRERIQLKSVEKLGNGESEERIQVKSLEELANGESKERIQLKSVEKLENGEPEEGIQLKSLEELANEESKQKIKLKSLENLSNDFKRLLEPKGSCFADVTLKCGDISIPAHKNILSARSPVFAAMFANPMEESRENEVDITDIDISILRAFLIYMYTGKTSDLTVSSAADLLFAAAKYQLQDLKRVCFDFLKDTVSPQNMLRVLFLGDLLDEDLESFAVDYFCDKYAEFSVFSKTEEWETLEKEKPSVALSVLLSLQKSMREKWESFKTEE